MQAFIPAAGLGTRLLTLTEHRPKALVEVGGVPLLKIAIDNLVRQGVTRIVVNVHHFADMLNDYLQSYDWGTEVLVSNEKDKLLDTGLDGAFLLLGCDRHHHGVMLLLVEDHLRLRSLEECDKLILPEHPVKTHAYAVR